MEYIVLTRNTPTALRGASGDVLLYSEARFLIWLVSVPPDSEGPNLPDQIASMLLNL